MNEISAANDYVRQVFNAPINLDRLKELINSLIEKKVEDYYFQRFKDWTVADLLVLTETINKESANEDKLKKKLRAKVDQNGQELRNA